MGHVALMRDTVTMCQTCVRVGRTQQQAIAWHNAEVARLRGAGGVGRLPGGCRSQRWWRRLLTLDVWFSGAAAIWYVFLTVVALVACAFGVYLVA